MNDVTYFECCVIRTRIQAPTFTTINIIESNLTAIIMKNIVLAIATITGLTFSSCYVGVEGGHLRHRHGTRVEIRTSNTSNQKDSLQSPAISASDRNDSLSAPINSGAVK